MTIGENASFSAANGWNVLPTHSFVDGRCTCGMPHQVKSNMAGKHPVLNDWPSIATSEASVVEGWFPEGTSFGYGVFAEKTGLFVFDNDPRAGGIESYELLDRMTDYSIPETVEVLTGEYIINGEKVRGSHKYFELPEGYIFPANLRKIGCPGIDIKVNGYVIGPGSLHKSGVKYEWKPGHAPWEIEIAQLPQNVLDDIAIRGTRRSHTERKSGLGDEAWETKWTETIERSFTNTAYAEKALARSCKEIKAMKRGDGRNNALNAKAYSLGHLIGGNQLCFKDARERLTEAARHSYGSEWAYKEESVESVLRAWGGGFEMGALEPKYAVELSPEVVDYVAITVGSSISDEFDAALAALRAGFFDPQGSLQLVTLQKAIELLGPVKIGKGKELWHYSNGVWKNDGDDEVVRRSQVLLGEKSRKAHTENLLHFMKAGEVELHGLGPEEFINCENGMLRISDLRLLPHKPVYCSTVQLSTPWNEYATCPTVDAFLEEMAFEDTIGLIWEVIGVCIFMGLGPQRGVFIRGSGRNGKGTILRLIRALIPEKFISSVELQKLGSDVFASAELFGKILNVVGDLSAKSLDDTATFKMLTGQDSINAQRKYGQPFSFTSQATLLFAANELPKSPDDTTGFFSRMLIIPMDKRTLTEKDIDKTLEPRMHQELAGVLVKAVNGLKRVLDRGGYEVVERCLEELENYKNPVDTVESFASSEIYFSGNKKDRVKRGEVYEDYEFFCISNELSPLPKDEFTRELIKKNPQSTRFLKSNGAWVFNGIQLIKNNPY